MGKVLNHFLCGSPGAVTRSADDLIISVKNAGETDVPFGAPVFLTARGAVPFSTETPQDFSAFLGFAVRVADKTPDSYPEGQFGDPPEGAWKAGDVMEVLVRGSIALPILTAGTPGGSVYVRKSDGKLTPSAGSEGSTVLLENVRIRRPRGAGDRCCEAVVNTRNLV